MINKDENIMKDIKLIDKIKYYFEKNSDQMIREYLSKLNDILDLNSKEHPWMREDVLDSELYACDINGKKIKLDSLLFGESTIKTGQNIIIITGDKHIGKKAFANKLLELCSNTVSQQQGNIKKQINKGSYRIPIIIDFEKIENYELFNLNEMIVQAIEMSCDKHHTKQEITWLYNSVNHLLANGRFLIYIKNKEEALSLEEKINYINLCKKEIQNLESGDKYNNIILFAISLEYDIKNTTLNNSHIITLKELTEQEIRNYLNIHIPVLLPIIDDSHNILDIMKYPEHLKMFEQLNNNDMLNNNDIKFVNEFELYDFFLTQHIRKQLQNNMKNKNINIQRENKIKISLQNYAWSRLSGKSDMRDPSSHFSFDNFRKIGILDDSGNFIFPYLNYYLIATYISNNIKNNRSLTIPNVLLEDPLNISLLLVSKMLDKQIDFEYLWDVLDKNINCKVNLLVRIVKQSKFYERILDRVYRKIFNNLTHDFYDYTSIEALDNLENNGIEYLNSRYLRLDEYSREEQNNIKKRYVYFLGISGNGIINEMITELLAPDTDLHLKYHIIRAMVENHDKHKESAKIINNRIDEISSYCSNISDPIIRSDFSILYAKSQKQSWASRETIDTIKNSLKKELSSDTYWKRAHAAGAIGRSDLFDTYEILIKQINDELQIIYTTEEKSRKNSIKVISYTVEAICELQERNKEIKTKAISELLNTINIELLGDSDIEDAYSTIVTGIECIINPEPNKLPFNLGGRFRNNLIEHKKVLGIVLQKLVNYETINDDTLTQALFKLKQLEYTIHPNKEAHITDTRKSEIKILHLTDLHLFDSNSNNNLILYSIKNNIKNVDILLVTGDLRNYGGDYSNALNKLNDITEHLNLSKSDVFIVPGNHDSYNYDGKDNDVLVIRKNIYEDEDCYYKHIDNLYKSFDDYKHFLTQFYEETTIEQGGIHNKLHTWKNCINILTMNTSLLCDSNSEQKKIVDTFELSNIENKNNLPTICISHHDIEQIHEDHKNKIKAVFENLKVSALLSGDVHRSSVKHIDLSSYTIPNYICGKLSADPSDKWSDRNIAIYELDFDKKILIPKLYKWEHSKYCEDNEFMKRKDQNLDSPWEYNPINLI